MARPAVDSAAGPAEPGAGRSGRTETVDGACDQALGAGVVTARRALWRSRHADGGVGSGGGTAAALDGWREAIGAEHVVTGGERLLRAQQATFATSQLSRALIEPADRAEVAACLAVAARHGVAVHPISGGRNWGYGSRVPPSDGAVLLSLARLDRILAHSEDLAYVTVEPGVTFGRLAAFLRARGSRLLPPLTGTTPDASVVGNVLERGIGKGPYEDMAARSCAYEVVLASGEVVRTGFAAYPGAAAAPLRADAPGPALQGLFCQSNVGVVTALTLWLEPAPALRQRLFFRVAEGAWAPAVDALRDLLLRGGTRLQAEMVNGYRVVAMQRQFPFGALDGAAALPPERLAAMLPSAVGARWFGCATLWADDAAELQWRRRRLESSLVPVVGRLEPEPPQPGRDAALSDAGIRSTYWRKHRPAPADPDPDRDRCGVIWLAPVLPMVGAEAQPAVDAVEEAMLAAGFEPSISLRMVGGRAIQAVVGLMYDREEPGADGRAAACQQGLRRLLDGRGLLPYRLGLLDQAAPPRPLDSNAALLGALKRLMDPQGVLAPGRYIPT